jgi:hypothetical protein
MEKDVDYDPCYLCNKYKGTFRTKDGVAVCPICKDDLHEDAPKGEEEVKKTFTGKDVKLVINGQPLSPFSIDKIDWKQPIVEATYTFSPHWFDLPNYNIIIDNIK